LPAVLKELRQADVERRAITLHSTLDRDLGLDSLARVELFTRIEKNFNVHLPESLFEAAETLDDIAAALAMQATTLATRPRFAVPGPAQPPTRAPPADLSTLDEILRWHAEAPPDFRSSHDKRGRRG